MAAPDPPSSLRDRVRGVYHRLRARAYRGDRVECPCCGGRFRAFLPFGVVRRPGAMCPACGSLERHRLLWLWLERRTDLFRVTARLLHLAPEPLLGRRLAALPRITYVSADLQSPLARVRADATRLAFRDAAFDVILCLHVLEHVPDDRAAMRELRRTLAPGGWAVLQSPVEAGRAVTFEDPSVTSPAERERRFGQRDHVRIYGRDYERRLSEAGFRVEGNGFARELGEAEALRYGIDRDEVLTIGR
jgi:SAM-dependent methyltransferase